MPYGKTSYLAELESGMRVLIVDANGRQRSAVVGRVKIESRPLILVEAVVGFFSYRISFIFVPTFKLRMCFQSYGFLDECFLKDGICIHTQMKANKTCQISSVTMFRFSIYYDRYIV